MSIISTNWDQEPPPSPRENNVRIPGPEKLLIRCRRETEHQHYDQSRTLKSGKFGVLSSLPYIDATTMWFQIQELHISHEVLAGIVIGGGLILIVLILVCVCLCFRRKDGKDRKRPQDITLENPPEATKAAAAVMPLQQPPRRSTSHLPPQSSMSSAGISSLPSQPSRHSPRVHQLSSANSSHSGGSRSSNLSRHSSSIPPPSPVLSFGSSQTMFTYEELAMATSGFAKTNILGQGGFGFVRKGVLPNGKEIAVKSLRNNSGQGERNNSGQGEREFRAEVETISRVHHRHLVSLVGYTITGSERLLVYEFVPNNTLEFHLHGKGQPGMDWSTRLKVAVGAAKGLAYLHEDCHPRIIHRDIKAANILLDNNFQAKVADFGLAKFATEADTHVSTRVMGTLGYLAPEYMSTGKLTDKSDIYSFGVVLLELITGRRPVDRTQKDQNLVEWARPLLTIAIDDEKFEFLVDPRLQNSYKHSEMAQTVYCAASCVRKSAKRRPLMSQVVRALEGNISLGELSEGMTPGLSLVDRYRGTTKGFQSSSEYSGSGSHYNGDSRGLNSTGISSEHDVTTSEFGLHQSSSSSEAQTSRELDTKEVQRENRRRLL